MAHPRVEEVSDSDSETDFSNPTFPSTSSSLIAPVSIPQPGTRSPPQRVHTHDLQTRAPPPPSSTPPSQLSTYSTLYPVYFDSSRSRSEGRRVPLSLAIPSPLAHALASAVSDVSQTLCNSALRIALQPDKTHPKDWANPGRVKVQLRNPTTRELLSKGVKGKAHLYVLVGRWLKEHPTQPTDPARLRIQGVPQPDPEKDQAPKVPRGWKIGQIVPLHSPAMSGGGVSENAFKDMMKEMGPDGGAGLPEGMRGMLEAVGRTAGPAGGASVQREEGDGGKKDKKKKKKK